MRPERILLLGGTVEARDLGIRLIARGHAVVTSLAGATSEPRPHAGAVRVGGFGGIQGLAAYIEKHGFDLVIDATHPFAAQISAHAAAAAALVGARLVRLERPPWTAEREDCWIEVDCAPAAAAALPRDARVLITVGRRELGPFFDRDDLGGVVRSIEPLGEPPPSSWKHIAARPPFPIGAELSLMAAEKIGWLVTKNAGGSATRSKILAAREKKIPVVMIARPHKPEAPVFATVADLLAALEA